MKALTVFLSLMTLTSTVACTEKGQPYQKHAPATKSASEQPATHNDLDSIAPDSSANRWKTQFTASRQPIAEVLVPLAERVLSLGRVRDPKSLWTRTSLDELILLNDLIIHTTEAQRQEAGFARVLALYEAALTTDCEVYRDTCTGMRYLKTAGASFQVVKLLAKNSAQKRFRLLLFAIEMKRGSWDPEIAMMLQTAPRTGLSEGESNALKASRHLLITSLQEMQNQTNDPVEARRFLDAVNAWSMVEYQADRGSENLAPATLDSLFMMFATSNYLYTVDGRLHPGLQALITQRESEKNGYMSQQTLLQTQNLFHPELIGATYISHFSELTYIVDSVYLGRISPQAAAQLYASSNKSLGDLQIAVDNYFRLQFLLALYTSSINVKTIFGADVQAQNLLSHVIEESATVARVWTDFKAKVQPLRTFAELAAGKRPQNVATLAQLAKLFGSTDKSILMAATYPQMLVLFHLLSQKRFELRLPGLGTRMDSGDLMSLLYNGVVDPLLAYSEDGSMLNKFQILYAFDMAVRTNLFQLTDIDTDFFIADTMRRLSGRTLDEINSELGTVTAVFKQDSDMPRLRNACLEFTKGELRPRTLYVGELRNSPYYGDLIYRSLSLVHSGSTQSALRPGDLGRNGDGLMYLDRAYGDMVEKSRTGLGAQISVGEAMIHSYSDYLRRTGATAATIDAKTTLSRKAIADLKLKQRQVLDTARLWFADVGSCFFKLVARNTEVQMQIIDFEKAYLRQVYRDIKELRAGADPDRRSEIQARIRFSGLPSDFKGLDRISTNGYLYSRTNLNLRMANYLSRGLQTDEGRLAAIAPHINIDYGQTLDLNTELVFNASSDENNTNHSPAFFLSFTASEDEFVNTAMRVIFNLVRPGSSYLDWASRESSYIIGTDAHERSLAVLYRFELALDSRSTTFTPQAVLASHEEALRAMSIPEKQRNLYAQLNIKQKYDIVYFDQMILSRSSDNTIADQWGMFDYPLSLLQKEALGNALDPKADKSITESTMLNRSMSETGTTYFQTRSRSSRPSLIIPYNPALDQHLDTAVRRFVRGEIAAIANAQQVSRTYWSAVEARPIHEQPRADVSMFMTITQPMISPHIVPNYNATVLRLHQVTQNCFASETPCPDFN